jgi:YrbI family 3-deoxy-D-manno-octulosonate 8-phosphate phosphatase
VTAKKSVLAIVQARGGSKGVPGKNLRLLGGHPLVAYSVVSGTSARLVDRVIVSTDDPAIAETGKAYGAEAPFFRPADAASDSATDFPLFDHAIEWLRTNEGYEPDIVVQLRPTTPFRPRGFLDHAIALLAANDRADCVRAVVSPNENPFKMWTRTSEGYLTPLVPTDFIEQYNMPRQALPQAWWQTGHVDVIRRTTITEKRSLTGDVVLPIEVERKYVVDIDRLADFDHAEALLREYKLDIDMPTGAGRRRRDLPSPVELVAFDFDGTMTDDRVWVDQDGRESVSAHRGDGMGISLLRKAGVPIVVLSTEVNPVVRRRCEKLQVPCVQGLASKREAFEAEIQRLGARVDNTVYVGNDINDLDCSRLAGFSIAVADAHAQLRAEADWITVRRGGYGAVREVCDLILAAIR